MIHAVIFDLDGTLLNTVDSMAEAGNNMLAQVGLPRQPNNSYRFFAGDGSRVLVQRALAAAGGSTDEAFAEQAHRLYISFFTETCTHNVAPYPGILGLLTQLQRHGIACAVLSNKPHQQTADVVSRFFPPELFAAVQGQVDGVPLKPDPQGVYAILRRLSLSPEQCLYVGDTGVDMETGRNAGITTVGVEWGFRGRQELLEHHACHIIQNPSQLLELAGVSASSPQ